MVKQKLNHNPYQIRVSAPFLAASLLGVSLVAFAVGFASKQYFFILQQNGGRSHPAVVSPSAENGLNYFNPVMTHVRALVAVVPDDDGDEKEDQADDAADDEWEFEHFFVDAQMVDQDLLLSKERLLHATMELVEELDIGTVLSHTCHEYNGIFCVAALQPFGHVRFNTWPRLRTRTCIYHSR